MSFPQAIIINDVTLSPEPRVLLYDKHVEYIANHGKDNAYVSLETHCAHDS